MKESSDADMIRKSPPAYFHRPGKNKRQNRFQRQDGAAVRARSKAKYHADPEKAKAINAEWHKAHPEAHREHVRRYWQRNKHRPEVKARNARKSRIGYWRRKVRKIRAGLKIAL